MKSMRQQKKTTEAGQSISVSEDDIKKREERKRSEKEGISTRSSVWTVGHKR